MACCLDTYILYSVLWRLTGIWLTDALLVLILQDFKDTSYSSSVTIDSMTTSRGETHTHTQTRTGWDREFTSSESLRRISVCLAPFLHNTGSCTDATCNTDRFMGRSYRSHLCCWIQCVCNIQHISSYMCILTCRRWEKTTRWAA